MYVINITDGTPEQIAEALEGVAAGFRQGAITDDVDDNFGTVPVWSNQGAHVGYITAIVEVTP